MTTSRSAQSQPPPAGRGRATRRGPRIHWILLGVNGLVLALPLMFIAGLRVYETYLVRQTERQLVAQSVVVAEAWRQAWLAAGGRDEVPAFRPPGREGEAFVPIEPVIGWISSVAPPQPPATRAAPAGDTPARRAGAAITPLLRRAQVFNLSAVRVLDAGGCVVATTRSELGLCLDDLPEVKSALGGRYDAIARQRISDEPLPPLSDVRSRGSIRIFTALPVFSAGRVVGVVRMSRTSLDALTSLWHSRRWLVVAAGGTVAVTVLVSILLAWVLVRPVRSITRVARAIARGEPAPAWSGGWLPPAEIAELAEALEVMTLELRQRAEYVAGYAADASHELKAPITAIRGAAELLRDEVAEMRPEQRARFVANIEADARRMERLVNRMLQLARIENAAAHVEPEAGVAVRDFFAAVAARYGEQIELRLDEPPARVRVAADHLSSAVINLVDNAIHHGGGSRPVLVEVGAAGARLRVRVTDPGPGISAANQARVFERFFTTERDRGGTGLGLAIVRAVAERYGGSISFASRPGETTFVLDL